MGFPVKLKKAEPIKRPIAEHKLETVQLKHHEFENQPQEPAEENLSSIRLSTALKQRDEENNDKVKSKKKVLKKKQKKTPEIEPDSESQSRASTPTRVNTEIDDLSSSNDKIYESESMSEFIQEEAFAEPKFDVTETKPTKDEETELKPVKINDKQKEPMMKTVSVDKSEHLPIAKKSESETKKEQTISAKDDLKKEKKTSQIKKPEHNKNDKVKKDEEKSAFPVKLKKAEPIRRPITEPKLETVQLKHHEFENQPQEPAAEHPTGIRLTIALKQMNEETDEKVKSKKKVLKKKQKKTPEIEPKSETQSRTSSPARENTEIYDLSSANDKMYESESVSDFTPEDHR